MVLAVMVLALHLPYTPASLEDLDSINFALGVRQFDVAQHQPHPPGYPVYIAAAKAVQVVVPDVTAALSLVSVAGAALAVFGILAVFRAWPSAQGDMWVSVVGTALAITSPLFWMTAVRPLSDMLGLALAVAGQALTLRAVTAKAFALAAFVAGVAVGVRSQVAWLTVPLLVIAVWMRSGEGTGRLRTAVAALVAYVMGALLWAVPLVLLSGGLRAYLRALATQGGEDFAGVAMLATQPSPRLLLSALYATWVAPWNHWPIALVVLSAAVAGCLRYWRVAPRTLGWLAVAYGPYAGFHLVFQETATTRYALPLVVPIAYLAASGLAVLPRRGAAVAAGAIAASGVVMTQPALRAYAATRAPAFQAVELMAGAGAASDRPALGMHRRQELDMRRPLVWSRDRLPQWAARLPSPPKHEWLELVKYWNGGGRAPIWFLADPPRSDLRLIDRHALEKVREYRWPFDVTNLLGGVRPNVMDLYRVSPPAWYAGEGWALTPETAGVAGERARGPGLAPIQAWVRRQPTPVTLMFGGRKLSGAEPTDVTVALEGRTIWTGPVAPGFFLHLVRLDPAALAGSGDYAELTVKSGTNEVAIEQFDVQTTDRTVYGFGDGWHELEYNPRTGRLWRWTSERAVLRVMSPRRALTLRLVGAFETSAPTAHVVVRAGDRVLSEHDVRKEFTLDVAIPPDVVTADGETSITLETDQWYVPAEANWRPTQDRRHLGLRVFELTLTEPR